MAQASSSTGPGLTADRVAGGFTELYYGQKLDPATGEVSDSGETLYPSVIGATLLELLGIDSGELGVEAIRGVLSD